MSEIPNSDSRHPKPLVSIILPAFNEESIIEKNVGQLYVYLKTLDDLYRWQVMIINDGSSDGTAAIADQLAETYDDLEVHHHIVNRNLGTALRTGFAHSKGDYVVVLDIDLSYSVDTWGNYWRKLRPPSPIWLSPRPI